MLQTFDKGVPLSEQRIRVAEMKSRGWKHKTKRRSWKVKEAAKRRAGHIEIVKRKFKSKVAAYWRGERDNHP